MSQTTGWIATKLYRNDKYHPFVVHITGQFRFAAQNGRQSLK
jgi:hypothetical protein